MKYFEQLKHAFCSVKSRNISLQQRMMLGILSAAVIVLAAILVLFTASGLFSFSGRHIQQQFNDTLSYSTKQINDHFDRLNAQGLKLSRQIATEIEYLLEKENLTFRELNNNPKQLEALQQSAYNPLLAALEMSDCSGAYILFDAPINTQAPAFSRCGLYLRRSSMTDSNALNSSVVLFRGMKTVARKNELEMHNRWNMEFDIKKVPNYEQLLAQTDVRAAECYLWSKRVTLSRTWEDVMMLSVPIVGKNGTVYGICGIEVSGLYFRLAHPATESDFGKIAVVLAPVKDGSLQLQHGMIGEFPGGDASAQMMKSYENGRICTYQAESGQYIGMQHSVRISSAIDKETQWAVAALLPAASWKSYTQRKQAILIGGSLLLLLGMFAVSMFLSRKCLQPITRRLQEIQDGTLEQNAPTGFSELDALIRFLNETRPTPAGREELPEGIREMFDTFVERTHSLTEAERNILNYYIQGYQIMDIPELAYISMSTVRKHNRSIYEKLHVASKDELMLYIDLLRRCGRLGDISDLFTS